MSSDSEVPDQEQARVVSRSRLGACGAVLASRTFAEAPPALETVQAIHLNAVVSLLENNLQDGATAT